MNTSNAKKAITAAWGYVAMGALSALVFLPSIFALLVKKQFSLGVVAASMFVMFGFWSMGFGVSRILMHPADREKWFEEFSSKEEKIRGGSRRLVVILGCIAIITIFGSSAYFLWHD